MKKVILLLLAFAVIMQTNAQQPPNTLNVKNNGGATGNGIVDDTDEIKQTITNAASQGKDVYFPTGQYKITSEITLSGGVSCYGDASGVSVIKSSTRIAFGDSDGNTAISNIEIKNLFFMNVQLNINGTNKDNIHMKQCVFAYAVDNLNTASTGDITSFRRGKNCSFDGCIFLNQENAWNQKGISTYKAQNFTLQHCIFGLDLGNLT
ncbi:glycoside hydrolase family 55 protein [Bacteroidales bacterium]|nr:glycoside hydrolase family 55 protein [Bacteroidales bacterium]